MLREIPSGRVAADDRPPSFSADAAPGVAVVHMGFDLAPAEAVIGKAIAARDALERITWRRRRGRSTMSARAGPILGPDDSQPPTVFPSLFPRAHCRSREATVPDFRRELAPGEPGAKRAA